MRWLAAKRFIFRRIAVNRSESVVFVLLLTPGEVETVGVAAWGRSADVIGSAIVRSASTGVVIVATAGAGDMAVGTRTLGPLFAE